MVCFILIAAICGPRKIPCYDACMGTINHQSVREEAERIKVEFERLSMDKKINSGSEMLIQSVMMLNDLLIAIFLEKTTKKNSKNSSKPPSQTEKEESSPTNKGTHGKGKLESNATASNTRTVEVVMLSKVTACDVCGENLRRTPCQHIESRRTIDIVFEKVVKRADVEVKVCPECDSIVKGTFPIDMPGPLQ